MFLLNSYELTRVVKHFQDPNGFEGEGVPGKDFNGSNG